MSNLCHRNLSECLNGAQCVVNVSANTTYCQCDPCYTGNFCETDVWKQGQFDTTYVYFIVFLIGLCFSILNNVLSLELFIRCERIRRTNCGIYLIVYCILSLLASIFLVVDQSVQYYPNQLINNGDQYQRFHCFVSKIGYYAFTSLCIWLSSCVAFERGLVICFNRRMNDRPWRSLIATIFIFAIGIGSATPLLVYRCDWDNVPNLEILRSFFLFFFIITGIAIYIIATVMIVFSFTRRIRRYGSENNSFIKTFLKLLYRHLFIFIPPIAYGISYIPYSIIINTKNPQHSYFECGISTGGYIIKVLVDMLQGTPYVLTWLLFILPSKDYMTEFYLSTWSGKRLAAIITCFKSCNNRKQNAVSTTINLEDNEHAMETLVND